MLTEINNLVSYPLTVGRALARPTLDSPAKIELINKSMIFNSLEIQLKSIS